MRTTVDLPPDIHQRALSLARDTSRSFSQTITDLLRRALDGTPSSSISRSAVTGLPQIDTGRLITTEDVRSLEDET